MGFEQLIYPRPEEKYLYVERKPVESEVCPECGSNDIRRYPVSCDKGLKIVIKCQDCFYRLRIEEPKVSDRWPPFRALAFEWPASPAEGGKE